MAIFATMWNNLAQLRQQYLDLNLDQVIDYEKFSMISIVYHSTKIEGCSLTETDTQLLLDKEITAKGKPLADHLMVKDHFEAFKFVKKEAEKRRDISIELMQEVAARVMKNTGGPVSTISGDFDTSKGDLRKAQVMVEKKYFPDFKKVPGLLDDLVDRIHSALADACGNDILKLAADFHYNLVNIHPFGDGNSRVSRLMMNYVQMYHREPLVKIFTEDRAEYIDSLNKTEAAEDINIFRDFICRQQMKFYQTEIEKFKGKDKGFTMMF